MRTMSLSFRRGASTILGALIFICIILTCVVPMWITKQQADLFYDRAVADMRQFDIDRASEDLSLSISNDIVYLKNLGSMPVNVVRAWLDNEEVSFEQGELNFSGLPEGTYDVMVVTARGRKFTTELSYIPEPIYTIYIMMTEPRINLHVLITFLPIEGPDIIVFDGVLEGHLNIYPITVPFAGCYRITVTYGGDNILFDDTSVVDPDTWVII